MIFIYVTIFLLFLVLLSHIRGAIGIWSEISPLERAKVTYTTAIYIFIFLMLCLGAGMLTWSK